MQERRSVIGKVQNGSVWNWCPGNGTRYEVSIVKVEGNGQYGWEQAYLVAWTNCGSGGKSCIVQTHGVLSWDYLSEKLAVRSPSDLAALLSLLSFVTGREPIMPPGYGLDGLDEHDRKTLQVQALRL